MTMPAPVQAGVAARTVDATKVYGRGQTEVLALDHVTVDFEAQRFTAIMGPSGSGKSTLLHCIAGLDSLTSGKVFIGDADLSVLDDRHLTLLRRDRVGFIFQAYNLVPTLNALENITLPLRLGNRQPDAVWLDQVVGTLGLGDRLHHRPSELSGGQQQRVAWRGRWRAGPRSSSATSRPATSTPRPAPRCSGSCATPWTPCT